MTGSAGEIYQSLFDHGSRHHVDLFDLHVASSILALAMSEAQAEDVPFTERLGLDPAALAELCSVMFPGAILSASVSPVVGEQEQALRDILWMYSAHASAFELLLSRMIARRSLRPNHLWQDLGLANRGELSMLMERHFPRLAQRNNQDMKWKKFFYRMMCSSEGFRLCAAPVCTECDDFDDCFGSEDGEALLARIANGRSAGAPASKEARL